MVKRSAREALVPSIREENRLTLEEGTGEQVRVRQRTTETRKLAQSPVGLRERSYERRPRCVTTPTASASSVSHCGVAAGYHAVGWMFTFIRKRFVGS
jgi:hypothetical protein